MTKRGRRRPSPERMRRRALELGALGAKLISPKEVYTAEWVRLKCQFGCGSYGSCLTCPPYSPAPEETRRLLDSYEVAILIHSREWPRIKDIVVQLEHEAFYAGYYKAFALGAGPCHLCEECAFEKGCRHPDLARPSMEACGIDVFKTAREAGFPIEVVPPEGGVENYFALLLLE